MLETRVNVVYSTNSEQVESTFEGLMLDLRLAGINVVSDGRTSAWKGSTIQGINIFLEQPSDLEYSEEENLWVALIDSQVIREVEDIIPSNSGISESGISLPIS
ncbi:hypothetical protein [Floridanema aerugineum]|uniref:Uncharacterized protein n=1 Tax=Floridaenema aerugineum BLCC-F46 TaxID=3153654 RepID=A0ABV4X1G0_9CYAN